jgi:hypothetical protein
MSRTHAAPGLISATKIVLGEIAEILESYPKAVIAGGTVPYLLIPQDAEPHEGTVDIDIVLDLQQPGADEVLTLHEILQQRLFQQVETKPYRYAKAVIVEETRYEVLIELLAGGDPAPSGLRRIPTEDVYVSIIQGMEVALENPVNLPLPGGSGQRVSVASLPAFFAMKAVALSRRDALIKPKDAYDIIYCLRNYPGGIDAMAREFSNVLPSSIVHAGVELLKDLFASIDSVGPVAYAKDTADPEEASLRRREAFERVALLLDRIHCDN